MDDTTFDQLKRPSIERVGRIQKSNLSTNQLIPQEIFSLGGLGWEAGKRLENGNMGLNSSSLQTTQAVN